MILIVTDEERGLRPEEHHQLQPPHRQHHHQPERQHLKQNQLVIQLNFLKELIIFLFYSLTITIVQHQNAEDDHLKMSIQLAAIRKSIIKKQLNQNQLN